MSKYIVQVLQHDYLVSEDRTQSKQIYYQETQDSDVVKKVAMAINSTNPTLPIPQTDIDSLLKRAITMVRGRYLTKEQEELVKELFCYRKLNGDE